MNKQSLLLHNNKIIIFTTTTILFLLFVLPVVMLIPIKMVPANDQPGYGDMGRVSVYGLRQFTQEFLSTDTNLMAIGTTIKNPNLKNKKIIKFNLYDEKNNLIREVKLNGFNIGDGDFVKFVFEPVPDSSQKKYNFTISSPEAGEEEILELFLIGPTDTVLDYSYDDETKLGGIPMVTFHKPDSRWETVKLVYLNLFSKLLSLDSRRI